MFIHLDYLESHTSLILGVVPFTSDGQLSDFMTRWHARHHEAFHIFRSSSSSYVTFFFLKSFESRSLPDSYTSSSSFRISVITTTHSHHSIPFHSLLLSLRSVIYRWCRSISYFFLSYIIIFLESSVGQHPKPSIGEEQAMAMKTVQTSGKSQSPWHLTWASGLWIRLLYGPLLGGQKHCKRGINIGLEMLLIYEQVTLQGFISSNRSPRYETRLKPENSTASGISLLPKANLSIAFLITLWPFVSRTALSSPTLTTWASYWCRQVHVPRTWRFWSQMWTQGWSLWCCRAHEATEWPVFYWTSGPWQSENYNHTPVSWSYTNKRGRLQQYSTRILQPLPNSLRPFSDDGKHKTTWWNPFPKLYVIVACSYEQRCPTHPRLFKLVRL